MVRRMGANPPDVALRGTDDEFAARIRGLIGDAADHELACPNDAAGMAWWYATNPALIQLSRSFDTDATLHVVANCVADLTGTGHVEAAAAVLERLFVEAHAARDDGAIGRATWCGWLLAGLKAG